MWESTVGWYHQSCYLATLFVELHAAEVDAPLYPGTRCLNRFMTFVANARLVFTVYWWIFCACGKLLLMLISGLSPHGRLSSSNVHTLNLFMGYFVLRIAKILSNLLLPSLPGYLSALLWWAALSRDRLLPHPHPHSYYHWFDVLVWPSHDVRQRIEGY